MPDALWTVRESALRRVLLSPLLVPELCYRVGAWSHRRCYRWGLMRRARLPAKVIAVGNLTVGGSGKTPLVGWLARELAARGRNVAILSRGVRGARSRSVNVVSDGDHVLCSPVDVGDEPVLLAGTVPGVPVLAGYNRVALGLRAAALYGAEILLLDDGFQHHRLKRDLNLVCIDAQVGFGNGHVLPRGPLREPVSALRDADAVFWTRSSPDATDPLPEHLLEFDLPQFVAPIVPTQLRRLGGLELESPDTLDGQDVAALAAVARPAAFRRALENLGARVVAERSFGDHHLYRRSDLDSLDRKLRWITTAKDAVKIPPHWAEGLRIDVLEEEVQTPDRVAILDWIAAELEKPSI
jgi:tetraacyldisaccharide 4'-kinase